MRTRVLSIAGCPLPEWRGGPAAGCRLYLESEYPHVIETLTRNGLHFEEGDAAPAGRHPGLQYPLPRQEDAIAVGSGVHEVKIAVGASAEPGLGPPALARTLE